MVSFGGVGAAAGAAAGWVVLRWSRSLDRSFENGGEAIVEKVCVIAREDLWQCDGYLTWPEPDDPNADVRGCSVAEVCKREGAGEWWPNWLEEGLTLDEAVEAARRRDINVGALLGSIWIPAACFHLESGVCRAVVTRRTLWSA
jgi:hypothetical protein